MVVRFVERYKAAKRNWGEGNSEEKVERLPDECYRHEKKATDDASRRGGGNAFSKRKIGERLRPRKGD